MDKDVLYYHEKLKESILIVEEGDESAEALNDVKSNFLMLFEYIKMFLIAKKERYYGYFLMDFSIKIDYYFNAEVAVSIDKYPFEMTINPLLWNRYSIKEMIFIICHEIEHIVLDHPSQGKRINQDHDPEKHRALNISMDASINDRLIWDIENSNLKMMNAPDNGITSGFLSESLELNLKKMEDFLYYYNYLKEKTIDTNDDRKKVFVILEPNKKRIVTRKNRPEGMVLHVWSSNDNSEDIHELIRKYVSRIVDGIPGEIRGLFPAHQKAALNAILAPPTIDWKNALKRYIAMTPYLYRKTKMRLNRRQPERFDIPGRVVNREVRLVVAIDTSGSVGKEDLEHIFSEIFEILKITKFDLTIIECDAEIQSVYKAQKLEDVNLNVNGRGGTSYEPVIEYINSSKEYRDAVLVFFTDGIGDSKISRPMVNRCLWVLTDPEMKLSVSEPYGDVISIGKKWRR